MIHFDHVVYKTLTNTSLSSQTEIETQPIILQYKDTWQVKKSSSKHL